MTVLIKSVFSSRFAYWAVCRNDVFTKCRLSQIRWVSSPSEPPVEKTKLLEDRPSNRSIVPSFVNNRNPRNLEKLRIAHKPLGWTLEKQDHSFWHKLLISLSGKNITLELRHMNGRTPIKASTNEWCIKKFLFSTKDVCAAKAVGDVFAHRCLMAGITEIACFLNEEERQKEKVATLIKAIEEGGVSLEEPPQFEIPWSLNYPKLEEKPWEVHETVHDELEDAEVVLNVMNKAKKSQQKS